MRIGIILTELKSELKKEEIIKHPTKGKPWTKEAKELKAPIVRKKKKSI